MKRPCQLVPVVADRQAQRVSTCCPRPQAAREALGLVYEMACARIGMGAAPTRQSWRRPPWQESSTHRARSAKRSTRPSRAERVRSSAGNKVAKRRLGGGQLLVHTVALTSCDGEKCRGPYERRPKERGEPRPLGAKPTFLRAARFLGLRRGG